MAGDWIKMRVNLDRDIRAFSIAEELGLTTDKVIFLLYKSASWFGVHGKYGVIEARFSTLDHFLEAEGFAAALARAGWLRAIGGKLMLHGFTNVSASRKSIGVKLRRAILASGKCASCGSPDELQIDHIIPIKKGGPTTPENLQPLCRPCNMRKGAK